MPNGQQFTSPVLGPDILARQLKMQQQAEWARLMQEEGAQTPQGQMVSGHYVAPSWAQYLAQGLKSYLGGRAMRDLPEQAAQIQRDQDRQMLGQFGFGGGMSATDALAGGQGPTLQNAQAMHGGNPMLIPGLDEAQSMAVLRNAGPAEYAKLLARGLTPTNEQRNLAHLPEWQRNALIQAPFVNQAVQDGMQTFMGPDGQIHAVPVPGFAQGRAGLEGAITGAQEQARAERDLVEMPTGDGGTMTTTRAQAIQQVSGSPGLMGADEASQALGSRVGFTPSEKQQEMRERMPDLIQQSNSILDTLSGLINHPGKEARLGAWSYIPAVRGTEEYDFDQRNKQLQGQVFLEGYERLKGGGVITDFEGGKAETAISRINQGLRPKEYDEAVRDLADVVITGMERTYKKSGMPMPDEVKQQIDGYRKLFGESSEQRPSLDNILGF